MKTKVVLLFPGYDIIELREYLSDKSINAKFIITKQYNKNPGEEFISYITRWMSESVDFIFIVSPNVSHIDKLNEFDIPCTIIYPDKYRIEEAKYNLRYKSKYDETDIIQFNVMWDTTLLDWQQRVKDTVVGIQTKDLSVIKVLNTLINNNSDLHDEKFDIREDELKTYFLKESDYNRMVKAVQLVDNIKKLLEI